MSDNTTTIVLQNLLSRFGAGDAAAKEELINRAHERLIRVARKLLASFSRLRVEEETAGIVNDAYLRLHSSLDQLKPKTVQEFMGLAALEIRRALLDRIRKMDGRGKTGRPGQVPLDADTPDGGKHELIDESFNDTRRMLTMDLLQALGELPDEEREAVELLFLHGWTQPEAAEIVGVHEDTMKRRWSRARIKLAGKLAVFAPEA